MRLIYKLKNCNTPLLKLVCLLLYIHFLCCLVDNNPIFLLTVFIAIRIFFFKYFYFTLYYFNLSKIIVADAVGEKGIHLAIVCKKSKVALYTFVLRLFIFDLVDWTCI